MQWVTHKAIAAAGALAVKAHPAALVAILIGSVLPDMIDTAIARGNKDVWRRIHRQGSHWFGWYLLLIFVGLLLPTQEALSELARFIDLSSLGISRRTFVEFGRFGNDIVVWIGIGGMVHILLDALTPMRVPIFPFGGKQRFGYSLVRTGTWTERVFLICALGAIAWQVPQVRRILEQVL